ncbi:hypothetical protein RvY_18387, partial [Ramazzottius varieornatus]
LIRSFGNGVISDLGITADVFWSECYAVLHGTSGIFPLGRKAFGLAATFGRHGRDKTEKNKEISGKLAAEHTAEQLAAEHTAYRNANRG